MDAELLSPAVPASSIEGSQKYIGTSRTRFETASHSDMQKISIIGVFSKYRRHWQFEVEKKTSVQTAVVGCIFIYLQIKQYLIPYVYLAKGGKT
jgi:hypothetical protein